MNAAFLGLKLVTDRLQDSTDEVEQEMYEVLNDVQLACNTSVEILNDLLCFDKIEGGILELHKQEVPVIRFLTETCRQFTGGWVFLGFLDIFPSSSQLCHPYEILVISV